MLWFAIFCFYLRAQTGGDYQILWSCGVLIEIARKNLLSTFKLVWKICGAVEHKWNGQTFRTTKNNHKETELKRAHKWNWKLQSTQQIWGLNCLHHWWASSCIKVWRHRWANARTLSLCTRTSIAFPLEQHASVIEIPWLHYFRCFLNWARKRDIIVDSAPALICGLKKHTSFSWGF